MKPSLSARFPVVLAPFLLCLLDQVLTLSGQTAGYWAGDYSTPDEGAPHGRWLLSRHPFLYTGAALLYLVGIVAGLVLLPRLLARVAAVALVIGHAWGSSYWVYGLCGERRDLAYWICLGMFLVSAVLLVMGFEISDRKARPEPTSSAGST